MPPGFLAGLGSLGGGFVQGQNSAADLRTKMMQIQQFQMALDQAKRQIAAQAAYGNALGQPQSSSPAGPSGAPAGVAAPITGPAGAPPSSPWQMAPRQPQAPPPAGGMPAGPMSGSPAGMPPQRPPMAPQQPAQPQASPAGQQGGGLQELTQALNSGQMDPQTAIMGIAAKIKAANPGIDPQTLEMATEQAVSLMHQIGLDPATKLQMQLLLGQQRGDQRMEQIGAQQAGATERTGMQQAGAERRTEEQQVGATGRTQMQQAGATGREQMRDQTQVQTAQMRIADADKRLAATQAAITARFQQGRGDRVAYQAQTTRARALAGELSAAKAELSAAVNAPTQDQGKIDAAMKKVDAVEAKLKILENAATAQSASGSQKHAAGAVPPRAQWPSPAGKPDGTALKWNGKVIANVMQGQWVPVSGGQ